MGEKEKTREQLAKELAQAQKRIAELEATATTSGRMSSLYYGIFENFVESATDSFSMWDSNLNLVYINNATLKYHPLGTKKSAVIGKNIKELIPNAEKSGRYEKYKYVLDTGKPLAIEDFKADPRYGDTYLSIKVFKIADGIGIISSDITERKRIEQALQNNQQRLSALLDNAPDVIFTYDINGRFISGNKRAEELMGYSKEEMIGKTFAESRMFTTESLARTAQRLEEYKKGVASEPQQYELIARDGSHIFVEVRGVPIVQDDKIEIIAIARDITERKMAEKTIRNSEEKLRAIFESISDSVTVIDGDGNIIEVNDAAVKLFGCKSKEETFGMNALTFIAEEDQPAAVGKLQEGKPTRFVQYKYKRMDGSIFWGETSSDILHDRSGNITGFIGIVRDITERKRIEKELNGYRENLEKMVAQRTTELASTNEELRESEERLRAFFENVPDILFGHDMTGKFTAVNKKALEISGYSRDDVLDKNILETGILPQDQIENVIAGIKGIEEGKSGYPYEVQLMKKNGDRITVEAVSFPIKRKGEMEVMGIARDITDRKRIENELKTSEEKLRTMFTSMADGVVVTDLEGNFKDANTAVLHMFGYSSKEDIRDANGFDFIAEKDRDLAMSDMAQLFREGLVTGRSWTFKHSSGQEFQAELSTALLKDAKGNPTDILVVMRDITERKHMEESLRESEEKLRVMFSSIADGIVVTDIEGNIKDLNDAQLRLFGFSKKEGAIGRNGFDFVEDKDRLTAMKDMSLLIEKGNMVGSSWAFVDRKGNAFKADVSAALMRDSYGNPTDIICVVRDVTERKRMEEALRESEAKLRAIYNSIGDGITVTDLKGTILDQNEAGIRISGYSKKEDVIGRNGLSFISETDRDRARNDMLNVLQKGVGITTEYKLIDKDGKEFDAEVSGAVINDSEGRPAAIVNVIRNITDRKRIEEALRESEQKLRLMFEAINEGIFVIDLDGKVAEVNRGVEKITSYGREQLLGQSGLDYMFPGFKDDAMGMLQKVIALGGTQKEVVVPMKTVNGKVIEVEAISSVLRDISGNPIGLIGIVRDISERKKAEAKLKESREELRFYLNQLTQAQEEERKRIARELHDDTIQELITLSRQLDDLTDKKIRHDEDRRGNRKKIEESQQKVTSILQSVRRFTRDLRPSVLDDLGLVPALEWLTSDMSAQFKIPIDISIIGTEKKISPNAALAMFRVAQESLRNAGNHSKATQIQLHLKFTSKTVTLSIIDNGKGFTPPKQISSLTKHGKLGVAGMYERAQLIGAILSIKSKLTKGTIITLEVPIKHAS